MIGRFGRTVRGRAKGGATLLLFAALVAGPEIATAKPFPIDTGPMPEGDPTADDQPSPTPKKKSARFGTGSNAQVRDAAVSSRRYFPGGGMTWELYLRILSRLALR